MKYIPYAIITFALLCLSCQRSGKLDRVIASVGEEVLTVADLAESLPPMSSIDDSASLANDYVRKWVTQKAILQKALQNVQDEEDIVEKAVSDYRSSLIVELYQQKLIEQKFAPSVSQKEVEDYYNSMRPNFVLKDHIVKGVFAIIPESCTGNLKDFRTTLGNFDAESVFRIEQFLFNYSTNYRISADAWIPFASIKKFFPHRSIPDDLSSLKSKKLFEVSNDGYIYFLKLTDIRYKDGIAPLEYVSKDIYNILLSKKKIQFLDNINKDIYNQALNAGTIKYYDKND